MNRSARLLFMLCCMPLIINCGGSVETEGLMAAEGALEEQLGLRDAQHLQVAPVGAGMEAPTPQSTALPMVEALGSVNGRQWFVDGASVAGNDANPGTMVAPFATIGKAMKVLRAGDEVIIGDGVYREEIIVPDLSTATVSTVIRARNSGKAIVNGADLVKNWVNAGVAADVWYVPWAGAEPAQVFRASVPLKQVGGTVFGGYPTLAGHPLAGLHASEGGIWPGRVAGSKTSLLPNSFTYDALEKRLYVRTTSPISYGEALEISTRPYVLKAAAAQLLTVSGLAFEHSNTTLKERHGAVYVNGSSNVLSGLTVRLMDGFCVMLIGNGSKLLDSTLDSCGQAGLAAYGTGVVINANKILSNNTRGFNKNWEASGAKFTGSPAMVDSYVTNNTVAFNAGDGLWFDWTPRRLSIRGNISAYNVGHGIHFEASQSSVMADNLVYGNGVRGIYLLESSNSTLQGNIVFANGYEGIAVANGTRSASNSALLPYGNRVIGNTSMWNDARRNRLQLMLPGADFANQSNKNAFAAADVPPRYSQGWLSNVNLYRQGLPEWRRATGQDMSSTESVGPMPTTLATSLANRQLLALTDLPDALRLAGAR